ncbi:MAG: Nif11-like leader peptide family natural product precursor [Cyanothece sp. SIO1E1]|nr:Nif11-like leader peptide family natural product precursor [Cyanothece sp. SIO1E1]
MSLEQIQELVNVIEADDALRTELQAQFSKETSRDAWIQKAVELGKEKGYEFTAEEVSQFLTLQMQSVQESEEGELEDAQLEAVAGGGKSSSEKSSWNSFMTEFVYTSAAPFFTPGSTKSSTGI